MPPNPSSVLCHCHEPTCRECVARGRDTSKTRLARPDGLTVIFRSEEAFDRLLSDYTARRDAQGVYVLSLEEGAVDAAVAIGALAAIASVGDVRGAMLDSLLELAYTARRMYASHTVRMVNDSAEAAPPPSMTPDEERALAETFGAKL